MLYGDGAYDASGGSDAGAEAAAGGWVSSATATSRCWPAAWPAGRPSGGELFSDVNAPSKAFGELVAETAGTPSLPAGGRRRADRRRGHRCARRRRAGRGRGRRRRFDEYATMSIPTAPACPGRSWCCGSGSLAPDPATDGDRELRGPDQVHHRRAVADQRRHTQPGRGAGATEPSAGPWPGWNSITARSRARTRCSPAEAARARRPDGGGRGPGRRAAGRRRRNSPRCSGLTPRTRTVYRFDVRTPRGVRQRAPARLQVGPRRAARAGDRLVRPGPRRHCWCWPTTAAAGPL